MCIAEEPSEAGAARALSKRELMVQYEEMSGTMAMLKARIDELESDTEESDNKGSIKGESDDEENISTNSDELVKKEEESKALKIETVKDEEELPREWKAEVSTLCHVHPVNAQKTFGKERDSSRASSSEAQRRTKCEPSAQRERANYYEHEFKALGTDEESASREELLSASYQKQIWQGGQHAQDSKTRRVEALAWHMMDQYEIFEGARIHDLGPMVVLVSFFSLA
jgi:hypothetical protein